MHKNTSLELENLLLDKLLGRLQLLQDPSEKKEIALQALDAVLLTDKSHKYASEFTNTEQKIKFVREFLSYGIIEQFLNNSQVEDIVIHGLRPIYLHHSEKGFIATQAMFEHARELEVFIKKLLVFSGRKQEKRIMDLELANLGGRVNIIRSPFGHQITITKAKADPVSVVDLIAYGSMSYELAAQLWVYIDGFSVRPANIMFAGGPGTGKTTLLNALLSFIPEKDHVVAIEDTLELNTFFMDTVSRLETDDELSLSDLVKNSLRMRPERIIVGEVRGEEARDMITAMNIGKYCMCTIHALTSREAIIRLQNEPMNIPQVLVNLIDVFVCLRRFHTDEKLFRVIDEVAETGGMESQKILLSPVYKFNYEQNRMVMMSPSTIYRDKLAREAGITPREVITETMVRAIVLKTIHQKGVHTLTDVTTFCRAYREDPEKAMSKIGLNRKSLLKEVDRL